MTDVAFSPFDVGHVAASASNGTVVVMSFDPVSKIAQRGGGKSEWDSGEPSLARSISKICWHPTERHLLASASMDGSIKIFDVRQKKESCQGAFNSRSDGARDVEFDPFDPFVFASVFENGVLSIWDRRNVDAPVIKISAHTMWANAVAWNPNKRGIIATGSRDKSVKVWSLAGDSDIDSEAVLTSMEANESGGNIKALSSKISAIEDSSVVLPSAHRPIHIIHTPAFVGRIRWRRSWAYQNQLATSSLWESGNTSSKSESGDVLIWNVHMPHMPACVLRGHVDMCTDFDWLDTPSPEFASDTSTIGSNNIEPSSPQSPHASHSSANVPSSPLPREQTGGESARKNSSFSSPHRNPPHAFSSSSPSSTTAASSMMQMVGLGVHQHILSVGKDGRVLIHDLRNAYFPRQHISRSAAAIAPQGRIAYHKGHVMRVSLISHV